MCLTIYAEITTSSLYQQASFDIKSFKPISVVPNQLYQIQKYVHILFLIAIILIILWYSFNNTLVVVTTMLAILMSGFVLIGNILNYIYIDDNISAVDQRNTKLNSLIAELMLNDEDMRTKQLSVFIEYLRQQFPGSSYNEIKQTVVIALASLRSINLPSEAFEYILNMPASDINSLLENLDRLSTIIKNSNELTSIVKSFIMSEDNIYNILKLRNINLTKFANSIDKDSGQTFEDIQMKLRNKCMNAEIFIKDIYKLASAIFKSDINKKLEQIITINSKNESTTAIAQDNQLIYNIELILSQFHEKQQSTEAIVSFIKNIMKLNVYIYNNKMIKLGSFCLEQPNIADSALQIISDKLDKVTNVINILNELYKTNNKDYITKPDKLPTNLFNATTDEDVAKIKNISTGVQQIALSCETDTSKVVNALQTIPFSELQFNNTASFNNQSPMINSSFRITYDNKLYNYDISTGQYQNINTTEASPSIDFLSSISFDNVVYRYDNIRRGYYYENENINHKIAPTFSCFESSFLVDFNTLNNDEAHETTYTLNMDTGAYSYKNTDNVMTIFPYIKANYLNQLLIFEYNPSLKDYISSNGILLSTAIAPSITSSSFSDVIKVKRENSIQNIGNNKAIIINKSTTTPTTETFNWNYDTGAFKSISGNKLYAINCNKSTFYYQQASKSYLLITAFSSTSTLNIFQLVAPKVLTFSNTIDISSTSFTYTAFEKTEDTTKYGYKFQDVDNKLIPAIMYNNNLYIWNGLIYVNSGTDFMNAIPGVLNLDVGSSLNLTNNAASLKSFDTTSGKFE